MLEYYKINYQLQACRHITEQILAISYRENILILPDDGHVVTETCRSHSE